MGCVTVCMRCTQRGDGGSKYLWSTGKLLPNCTASHSSAEQSRQSPLWDTQIFTSLHLIKRLLPVRVESLQTAFHLSRSRATISLTPFHSVSLSFKIVCIPSAQVFPGVRLVSSPMFWLARQFWVISHPSFINAPKPSQFWWFYHFVVGHYSSSDT
jgi:hypothetical protein